MGEHVRVCGVCGFREALPYAKSRMACGHTGPWTLDYGTDPVRKPLEWLTSLGRAIVADVQEHGPSTAEEIAGRMVEFDGRALTAHAVRSSCATARGERWLDDGSIATPITMESPRGPIRAFAHTDPPFPIKWRYIPDEEAVARWAS